MSSLDTGRWRTQKRPCLYRPGLQLLSASKDAGVNFIAMWGYPLRKSKSRIDLIAEDPGLFKELPRLAKSAAKDINVYAVQALCAGNGRFGALIQVDPDGSARAAKALA